ncbi:hypothetical protein U1Q18_002449 [Sarracenia purpurea var. burkii]
MSSTQISTNVLELKRRKEDLGFLIRSNGGCDDLGTALHRLRGLELLIASDRRERQRTQIRTKARGYFGVVSDKRAISESKTIPAKTSQDIRQKLGFSKSQRILVKVSDKRSPSMAQLAISGKEGGTAGCGFDRKL